MNTTATLSLGETGLPLDDLDSLLRATVYIAYHRVPESESEMNTGAYNVLVTGGRTDVGEPEKRPSHRPFIE
jgi:hypothetical protein